MVKLNSLNTTLSVFLFIHSLFYLMYYCFNVCFFKFHILQYTLYCAYVQLHYYFVVFIRLTLHKLLFAVLLGVLSI